ncbi:MAG: hypothetical protein ABS35_37690 [Kaistia sp. SCN 65-12]|nr:MAG: hypothetical protein ABS35_37690 [Kaistia sp. SCN 65-12]
MANLSEIKTEAEKFEGVYSTSIWNDRRVYINFVGADRSFAGCRNLKVYYDIKTGWQFQGDKGNFPADFIRNARAFAEHVGMHNSRGGSPF